MKRIATVIICALALLVSAKAKAQTEVKIDAPDTTAKGKNQIYTSVEQTPEFYGGIRGLYTYLQHNIHYPADAYKNHIQGKVVLAFIIEKDGSVNDVKVVRKVSDDIDAEAIRVMKTSPKWVPGKQNGRPVRVAYSIPISFSLDGK